MTNQASGSVTTRKGRDLIRRQHLDDKISSHWQGCELVHVRCALAKALDYIDELESLQTPEEDGDLC